MASGTDIENTKRLVEQNKKDNQQLIKKNRSKLVSPGLLPKAQSDTLPVSRNHQGRRSTTVDIVEKFLPSLMVLGCPRPVYLFVLSSHLLFCLFLCPGIVPRKIFSQRPRDLTTCPNHRTFHFFTVDNRSS